MWSFVDSLSFPMAVLLGFAVMTVFSAANTALGFAIERSPFGRSHRVFDVPLESGQYRRELRGNVVFLVMHAVGFAGLLELGWIRGGATGWGAFALTFVVSYFAFESSYFLLHRLMHVPALLRFHRFHHLSRVTTPLTGLSVGPGEAFGWVVCLSLGVLILSLFGPVSFDAWVVYLAYNFAGNIVGHSNAEFFPNGFYRNWYVSNFLQPVICHALHHARWTGHYGFASLKYDRMIGAEYDDWTVLHKQVAEGQPMKSLRESAHVHAPH